MTEYEVKCPQTWAWFTAFVHDYNDQQKKLYIKYPNDWKQPEWLDAASVRYKYPSNLATDSSWHPSYNEEVECKARAEEREPYGWWPCKAKKYTESTDNIETENESSELYSVAFIGWGDQHNEILGIEYIRKKSTSQTLGHMKNLFKHVYDVPNELREWVMTHCSNNTILETLMPHKNISSQIIHITYLEKSNKLLLIGVKRVLITMNDIMYCFFEKQKSLLKLEDKTRRLEEQSKLKKEQELKAEKNTFNIHPLLSGYLRGRGGSNIDRVKRMFDGQIIRIEPQTGSCYIAAKDKNALKLAVDQLEIVCKKVIIPKDEMGQIIGSQGKQIQDIKKKSQVIKVISWSKWPYEFDTLKDIQSRRYIPYNDGYGNMNMKAEDTQQIEENIPDIISNATLDNIFETTDIIDLSAGYNNNQFFDTETEEQVLEDIDNDALVIIGRKSRVELCVFMIEMTLNHFRNITKTRNNVRLLRREINKIKGNPIPTYNRNTNDRYKYQRDRDNRRNRDNRDRDQRGYGKDKKGDNTSPKYGRYGKGRYQPKGRGYQQRGGGDSGYQNGNSKKYREYEKPQSDIRTVTGNGFEDKNKGNNFENENESNEKSNIGKPKRKNKNRGPRKRRGKNNDNAEVGHE